MQELYFPEAIILDREDSNDVDSRFSIYAKGYGKFFAKAKSAKKILSKLSGHLEPGNLVKIRLVGNGAWQVVDALKFSKVLVGPPDLYLLNQLLPEADFDFELWEMLLKGNPSTSSGLDSTSSSQVKFSWPGILKILGWDPEHAICEICQNEEPRYFNIRHQGFVGEGCYGKGKFFGDGTRLSTILIPLFKA